MEMWLFYTDPATVTLGNPLLQFQETACRIIRIFFIIISSVNSCIYIHIHIYIHIYLFFFLPYYPSSNTVLNVK